MQKNTPKLLFFSVIFLCLIQASFISCSQDEDLIDLVGLEDPDDETVDGSDGDNDGNSDGSDDQDTPDLGETDNGPDFDSSEGLKIDNTPCDYTLDGIESNSTLEIACRMDLGGQTITVPSGVTFVFAGGEIINGTLNFSAQGTIDGNLLNKDLNIEGDVRLKSQVFLFYPERWGIIEGTVGDEVATNNRDSLEGLFYTVHNLGGNKFMIDDFDAFFKVDGLLSDGVPEEHAINLPSNFHLEMNDNVHIRMQPNGHFRPVLIAIYDENNVTITGGNFYGDRETHNYNSGFVDSDGTTSNTHEWVKTMAIKGGKNIVIEDASFIEAGVGLTIGGIYFYYETRHISSENIYLKNNKFLRARQTNLVITNGKNIFIEGNELVDGGIDMPISKGVAPSSNLNIEPFRGRNQSTGELLEYERVSDIYIRNNKQIVNNPNVNPKAGSFQISHGNGPIVVENNEMINTGVSFTTVDGLIIRNNVIDNGTIAAGAATNTYRNDVVFNNEIYNNVIKNNEGVAVNIAGNGVVFRDNEVEGEVGITLGAGSTNSSLGLSSSVIENNIIRGRNRGIVSYNAISDVIIQNNDINMLSGSTFAMVVTNTWSNSSSSNFKILSNRIKGTKSGTDSGAPASLFGANDVQIRDNSMGEIQINGGFKMIFEGNTIEGSVGSHGMKFMKDAPNSVVTNNDIIFYSSGTPLQRECIFVNDGVVLTNVEITNNDCIER